MTSAIFKKYLNTLAYSTIFAGLLIFSSVNVAEARTTPCGQFDQTYGYYGQCDANNNPIANTTTNNTNTNTNTDTTSTPYYNASNNYGYVNNIYSTTGGGTYSVNQYGYEYTTQLPSVACNQYDSRQGGYVVCDATGNSVSYWITPQASSYPATNNVTVNYTNANTNTQNPYYYSSPYNASNNYGYVNSMPGYNYSPYGNNYGSNYGNSYGSYGQPNSNYGYNNNSTASDVMSWAYAINGLASLFGGSNSYGSGYGNYSSPSYTYVPTYDYVDSCGGCGSNYGSSYYDDYSTYSTPSRTTYTYPTQYEDTSTYDYAW